MLRVDRIGELERLYFAETLEPDVEIESQKIFKHYHDLGVIINKRMEDDIWLLTDEKHCVSIPFALNTDTYAHTAESWLGCPCHIFLQSVRVFVLFLLGVYVLNQLRSIAKACIKLGSTPMEKVSSLVSETPSLMEFLKFLPGSTLDRDRFLESMDWEWQPWSGNSRQLSTFSTYVTFEDLLEKAWTSAEQQTKVELFPVYLWWTLTCILPLRPTEFILTPRDCLRKNADQYELSVRRTRLKKGRRAVYYKIEEDYEIFTYPIPNSLAKNIMWYREIVAFERQSKLATLLIPGKHAEYMSYSAMAKRLADTLESFHMERDSIHLGDTRHLSMISLILTGDTPSICKALANHENVVTSAGYYGNMSTLTDCRILHFLHDSVSSVCLNFPTTPVESTCKDMLRHDNGRCAFYTTQSFVQGNAEECTMVWHPSGGMGYCRACPHYIPDSLSEYLDMKQDTAERMRQNWQWLMDSIELLRKSQGHTETVEMLLKNLQSQTRLYMNMADKSGIYIATGATGKDEGAEQPWQEV